LEGECSHLVLSHTDQSIRNLSRGTTRGGALFSAPCRITRPAALTSL
jgi:hypothetical protein